MVLASGIVAGVVVPEATTASVDSADVSAGGGASLLQNASSNGSDGSADGTETPGDGDSAGKDSSNDTEASTDGGSAESEGAVAYQFDVAVGEVITDLGSDEDAFYARQGRLLQAQTVRADGSVTGSFRTMASPRTVEGCQVAYDPVSYDSSEVTVEVSVDGCESATLTLAVYELPDDTVEFRRDRADEQELVAHRTTTVDGGETVTLSVAVDADDSSGGDAAEAAPSESDSAEDSPRDDAAEEPTGTPEEPSTETPEAEQEEEEPPEGTDSTPTETETETPEETATETETPEAADGSADLSISDVNKEVDGNERENLERETVTITNDGDTAVDLSGYTLVYGTGDERQQTYTFSEGFALGAGESVTVHTGEGTDTETDVYLGSGNPVLNNEESERLVLRNDDGDTVAETTT